MDNPIITKEQLAQKITEVLPEFILKALKDEYDSPVKKAIEEEMKEQDGVIRKLVRDVIGEIVSNKEFKEKIGEAIIAQIIQKGLN